MTKILSKKIILDNYNILEIADAVQDSYKHLGNGRIVIPPRSFAETRDGGDYLYGAITNLDKETYMVLGSAYMPWRAKDNKPIVEGTYLYMSFQDGSCKAVVNGVDLVNFRTGAKSTVAAKYLAKESSSTLGLIGLGNQARTQAEAICGVFDIKRIIGFSRNEEKQIPTKEYIKEKTSIEVESVPIATVTEESDIIVIGTHSKEPLISFEDLKPGQLLISLAHAEEVSKDIVTKAKTYVDFKNTALNEFGPVKAAIEEGFDPDKLAGDLCNLVNGEIKGRESDDEIIYFQSLGVMNEDLATLEYLYEKLKDVAPKVDLEG